MATTVDFVHAYTAVNNSGLSITHMSKEISTVVRKKCMNAKTAKDVRIVLSVPRNRKEIEPLG